MSQIYWKIGIQLRAIRIAYTRPPQQKKKQNEWKKSGFNDKWIQKIWILFELQTNRWMNMPFKKALFRYLNFMRSSIDIGVVQFWQTREIGAEGVWMNKYSWWKRHAAAEYTVAANSETKKAFAWRFQTPDWWSIPGERLHHRNIPNFKLALLYQSGCQT